MTALLRERDDRPQPGTKKRFPSKASTPSGSLHPSHASPRKSGTQSNPNGPIKGGMKPGFLLPDSSNKAIENKPRNLPQCKSSGTRHISVQNGGMQPKKRTPITSSALLECEEALNEHEKDDGFNRQSEPFVSSLLRVIEDEPDDFKETKPLGCDNDLVLDDDHYDDPSIDGWITQQSSSQPSLVIPPSGSARPRPQRKKSGKPLVVEVNNPTMVQEEAHSAAAKSPDSS